MGKLYRKHVAKFLGIKEDLLASLIDRSIDLSKRDGKILYDEKNITRLYIVISLKKLGVSNLRAGEIATRVGISEKLTVLGHYYEEHGNMLKIWIPVPQIRKKVRMFLNQFENSEGL